MNNKGGISGPHILKYYIKTLYNWYVTNVSGSMIPLGHRKGEVVPMKTSHLPHLKLNKPVQNIINYGREYVNW